MEHIATLGSSDQFLWKYTRSNFTHFDQNCMNHAAKIRKKYFYYPCVHPVRNSLIRKSKQTRSLQNWNIQHQFVIEMQGYMAFNCWSFSIVLCVQRKSCWLWWALFSRDPICTPWPAIQSWKFLIEFQN